MFSLRVDEDITLRLLDRQHADALFEAVDGSREHLGQYLPSWTAHLYSEEAAMEHIVRQRQLFADELAMYVGMFWRGALVGQLSLRDIRPQHRAELGYWQTQAACGQGLMTRAARVLIDAGFDELGLGVVMAKSRSANRASVRLLERLGFRFEGTEHRAQKYAGEWFDFQQFYLPNPAMP